MVSVLISFLILVLILSVIWWVLSLIPLPPPFRMVAQVVIAVIALIYLITLLLPYTVRP
jgi:hypothetical protein